MLSRSRSALLALLLPGALLVVSATGCRSTKAKPEVRLARTTATTDDVATAGTDGLTASTTDGSLAAGPKGANWSPNGGAPDAASFEGSGSMTRNGMGAGGTTPNGTPVQKAALDAAGSIPNGAATDGVEAGQFTAELEMIHFEYDKSDVADAWKPVLDKHAEWIKANASVMVQVEGHCDERGTEEYNVSLGQRRADAVRTYLVEKGIDANRISTISYGKMRPLNSDGTEEAMALNRRAMFLVYSVDAGQMAAAPTTAEASTN